RAAPMKTAPVKEEEWRKTITSELSSGASIVLFDNVDSELSSAALSSVLTARFWTDRLLGRNDKTIVVPQNATWIATGNNLQPRGDLPRRCYWVRLDAELSQPWRRTGFKHDNLLQWISENRGQLLWALLTLIRAWFAAGKPAPNCPPPIVGSFTEWVRITGSILAHSGICSFLSNLDELYSQVDDSTAQWETFLNAIYEWRGSVEFKVSTLLDKLTDDESFKSLLPDEVGKYFEAKSRSFQTRLGNALKKKNKTRFGDHQIHLINIGKEGKGQTSLWKVIIPGRSDASDTSISQISRPSGIRSASPIVDDGPVQQTLQTSLGSTREKNWINTNTPYSYSDGTRKGLQSLEVCNTEHCLQLCYHCEGSIFYGNNLCNRCHPSPNKNEAFFSFCEKCRAQLPAEKEPR
ncbi:hypothetical protein L0244_12580, partial [bacterium]|nr:hypothetical protein [bacterium]